MIRRFYKLTLIITLVTLAACDDNEPNLPPVEERINEAVNTLRNDLIAPSNGWRLEYQPTPEAGIFFMLLDFKENGEVNIRSDVADNDGEFFDHTITYRIDNALGLELILETFGVFHHMFELDQATFGAEFEFLFKNKDGSNLIFESKSDVANPTILTFEPASVGDVNIFALDIATNFNEFQALSSGLPSQQLILENQNISIFWTIDLAKRNVQTELVAVGSSFKKVIEGGEIFSFSHNSGYTFKNGKMVLMEPLTLVLNQQSVNITEIVLNDFDMSGPSLCNLGGEKGPKYKGQIQGSGNATLLSSLLSTRGADFQPGFAYTVNVFFVFDAEGNSLSEEGIIQEKFPTASGFAFLYDVDLTDPDIPGNSLGLILDDGSLYLREFEPTTTDINRLKIKLTDNFFFDKDPAPGEKEGLREITDLLFEGEEVYAFDFPVRGLTVFRLFNPCNSHEIFLVQ